MIEPTDKMVTAAAEVAEDEMIRRLGRDLGTIHRNEIVRAILAAGLAIVERDQLAPLRAVLDQLIDPHACHYDHHGDCQEHGTTSERPCPHARAKELLGWSAP